MTTLVLVFKKIENEDKTKYGNFCFSLKAETVINDSDIGDVFPSICTTVIAKIQKSLGKGSGWIIDSVIDHTISISKYNLLAGSNYEKLPKDLNHPREGLINIQNVNYTECFKWCFKWCSPSKSYKS